METLEIFANNLKALRKEKGLSQKTLSTQADVPLYMISRCEKGKGYHGLENFIKLANFFGVTADRLFGRE